MVEIYLIKIIMICRFWGYKAQFVYSCFVLPKALLSNEGSVSQVVHWSVLTASPAKTKVIDQNWKRPKISKKGIILWPPFKRQMSILVTAWLDLIDKVLNSLQCCWPPSSPRTLTVIPKQPAPALKLSRKITEKWKCTFSRLKSVFPTHLKIGRCAELKSRRMIIQAWNVHEAGSSTHLKLLQASEVQGKSNLVWP